MKSDNLRIKRHFSIIGHNPNEVELRSGVWNTVSYTLQDESKNNQLLKLLVALDGKLSISEIAEKHKITRSEIESVIDQLRALNVIESAASTALDHYIETALPVLHNPYDESTSKKPRPILLMGSPEITSAIQGLLLQSVGKDNISVLSEDDELYSILKSLDTHWIYDALKFEILVEKFKAWKDYFCVLALKDINPLLATKFNKIAHELNIPWIHVAIDGPFLFIGPTFSHQQSPCYDCFETRVSMNLREYASYQKYKSALQDSKVINREASYQLEPVITQLLASHAVMEILNFWLTNTNFTRRKVLSFYLPTMEITFNEVLTVASCKTCGSVTRRDDHQLYFDMPALLEESNEA